MLLFALSDEVMIAIVTATQVVAVAAFGALAAWMNYKTKAIGKKIDKVDSKVDGIIPKLEAAAKERGTNEERERVAAVGVADAAKEAEIVRRIDMAHEGTTVASNVQVIKQDVKDVKRDVADVKTEVTREVRDGVKQGISEAKEQDK